MLEILPTPEEEKKLLATAGLGPAHQCFRIVVASSSSSSSSSASSRAPPPVPLHEAEAFMLHTMKVPRMRAKTRCLHFVLGWQEAARALAARMEAMARAFGDVMRSDRLVRVLEVLLYIGNTMNAYSGSSAAGVVVEAFTIDSLFRVALTKSTVSGDVTLLDYFVRLAAEQGEGAILDVAQDMPTVQLAAALPDCSAVLREVRGWLREFESLNTERAQERRDLDGAWSSHRTGHPLIDDHRERLCLTSLFFFC